MSKASREKGAKVGGFAFDPKKSAPTKGRQLCLLFEEEPLDELSELKKHLLKTFRGSRILFNALFYQDNQRNTKYTEQNYKDALRELEVEGKIEVNSPNQRRIFRGKIAIPPIAEITFK